MRRRVLFLTAPVIVLVAALTTGADRRAEAAFHGAKGPPSAPSKRQALATYAKLPLSFTPNAGQFDRRVRYATQAGSSSVFFTRRGIVLSLAKGKRGAALRLGFLGANRAPPIVGTRPGPGRVNYLLGNDPARWQTNLPTYEEMVYRRLWPGVDLHLRGENGQLKYEFRLAPGAEPSRIRLAYRGQERLALGRGGELRIASALGHLRDARPLSYQAIGGRRIAIKSQFVLGRRGAYSFSVGSYDRRYPLVIDPGLVYSTYLGGNGDESGKIAVGGTDNAYVMGTTTSVDFPTTAGAYDTTYNGSDDAFVTKLNAAGTALEYSTYLGGSGRDASFSYNRIAVDGAGHAYLTGYTESGNFPTTPGAFDRTYGGQGDAFVAELSATGAALMYSTYLGGGGGDTTQGIVLDSDGNAGVAGFTTSTDLPTTAGAYDTTYNGGYDAFITKIDATGAALIYSTYLGGGDYDRILNIAADAAGGAYVTGYTISTDFPTTAGAFDTTFNGNYDAFVTKLDASGAALGYSTYLGGSAVENGSGIAIDETGSASVTGTTSSEDFPTSAGAFDETYNGLGDAFVTKLDASGSALNYSTFLGGSSGEVGGAIALDDAGSPYLTGRTASSDFPTTPDAFDSTWNGNIDVFMTKMELSGSALVYSTFLGGAGADLSGSIALDGGLNAYLTGDTQSTDFPTTAGAFDTTANGGADVFVTKLDIGAGPPPPPRSE